MTAVLRVLHLAKHAPPARGGIETAVAETLWCFTRSTRSRGSWIPARISEVASVDPWSTTTTCATAATASTGRTQSSMVRAPSRTATMTSARRGVRCHSPDATVRAGIGTF